MNNQVVKIAKIMEVSYYVGLKYCQNVQNYLIPFPSFKLILRTLQKSPDKNPSPKTLAQFLVETYPTNIYRIRGVPKFRPFQKTKKPGNKKGRKRKLMERPTHFEPEENVSPPPPKDISRKELLTQIAPLFPDPNKGNLNSAVEFLETLNWIYPRAKRVNNRNLLLAIRRAKYAKDLTVDGVFYQLRKIIFGYRGDPDAVREISIPMGGKPDR